MRHRLPQEDLEPHSRPVHYLPLRLDFPTAKPATMKVTEIVLSVRAPTVEAPRLQLLGNRSHHFSTHTKSERSPARPERCDAGAPSLPAAPASEPTIGLSNVLDALAHLVPVADVVEAALLPVVRPFLLHLRRPFHGVDRRAPQAPPSPPP